MTINTMAGASLMAEWLSSHNQLQQPWVSLIRIDLLNWSITENFYLNYSIIFLVYLPLDSQFDFLEMRFHPCKLIYQHCS